MSDTGYWYMSTPYRAHPRGRQASFDEGTTVAVKLVVAGYNVFHAIGHSHPINERIPRAFEGDVVPWVRLEEPFMDAARGCLAVLMDGHLDSSGMAVEIQRIRSAGKPVVYVGLEDPVGDLREWEEAGW